MQPSRRDLLRRSLYAGGLAAGGFSFFPSRAASAAARAIDPRGTTLERSVVRGTAGAGGYRLLTAGPGKPHVVREDLGAKAGSRRAAQRSAVAVFIHHTDTHVVDAQSPARVEFLDRYSDDPTAATPFRSAWRPQEPLSLQLADAVVRGAAKVTRGPVTGAPVQFAVATGDNIDNAQLNELRWSIDVYDGATVTPNSGDPARFEGVMDDDAVTYDIHYWHPHGTADRPLAVDDNARRNFGYPVVPGLLDQAVKPFRAHGIRLPWYTCFGNHDPLLQGNAPTTPAFEAIATGSVKVVGLAPGVSPGDLQEGISRQDPDALQAFLAGPARVVTPDPDRRIVSRAEIIEEHFTTTGLPVGHGFTSANRDSGLAYYAFDVAPRVRGIVLDTCAYAYADGSIDVDQLAWLEEQLDAASSSKLDESGQRVPAPGSDRLVVMFSHHTIETMNNPVLGPTDTAPRVMGDEVRDLLLRYPNVVLWVNGHTHRNAIQSYQRSGGGGFWEVNTAAHIDFPSQARVIELVNNLDGTLSVFATLIDADAPLSNGGRIDSPTALAALARELGANDWQARDDSAIGPADAGNTELLVAAPFPMGVVVAEPTAPPFGEPLPATGLGVPMTGAAAVAAAAAGLAAVVRRRDSLAEARVAGRPGP